MAHRKNVKSDPVSVSYIREICTLYGDCYDDRIEDSRPPAAGKKKGQEDKRSAGEDWEPGMPASHKSLSAFQKELAEKHGMLVSTSKIRKVLITGGLWSTERSREVQALYYEIMKTATEIKPETVVETISKKLSISRQTVVINLPYINGVNRLEPRSKNAVRCSKYREKKKENSGG